MPDHVVGKIEFGPEPRKKGYDKRERGAVFLTDEHSPYLAHLPAELKGQMATFKQQTGKSYNLMIIEALELYFEAR